MRLPFYTCVNVERESLCGEACASVCVYVFVKMGRELCIRRTPFLNLASLSYRHYISNANRIHFIFASAVADERFPHDPPSRFSCLASCNVHPSWPVTNTTNISTSWGLEPDSVLNTAPRSLLFQSLQHFIPWLHSVSSPFSSLLNYRILVSCSDRPLAPDHLQWV